MSSRRLAPILAVSISLAFCQRVAAQSQVQKLVAADGQARDVFGKSVAVHGDRALVGQPGIWSGDSGSLYAFRRIPSGWFQAQILHASDAAPGDWFGYSAAMSETAAVVGAIDHDHGGLGGSGAVYVFELEAGGWHEVQELLGVAPQASDHIGLAVDIDGDVLVASAVAHGTGGIDGAGVVYVFERRPHGWIRTAALAPADTLVADHFGNDVAVSGTRIAVGKSYDNGLRGAAYIFEKTPQGWVETAKLTASDGAPIDHFGWSIDLDGDRVLVGAVAAGVAGAAYLFERTPSGWVERAKLSPADSPATGNFGYEVSLEGDTALVGTPGVSLPSPPGAVYVYRRDGGAWPFVARLSPADEIAANGFGAYLATDGETLLAGALWDDDLGYQSGSAYVFALPRFATPYGFCAGAGICGNGDPVAGCANSTLLGARIVAGGSGSLASDDFALAADHLPPGRPVVFFRGSAAAAAPLGDGLRQVAAGSLGMRRYSPVAAAADGTASLGPGTLAGSGITPGETWFFQARYADPAGPCGSGFNATSAVRTVFGP